ncbi:unnamed protein product [Choristocarpus tenellus]
MEATIAPTTDTKEGMASHNSPEERESRVPDAAELLLWAREFFLQEFGVMETSDTKYQISAGYAPGRVNLIGEHTDYTGGFVMPLALEMGTVVYGRGSLVRMEGSEGAGRGGMCKIVSKNMREEAEGGVGDGGDVVSFCADETLVPGEPEWANYVKGVVKEYMVEIPKGMELEFEACVVGTVPIGGGVSSSASLSVAMATFLEGIFAAYGIPHPLPTLKAHRCRMAEHKFLSTPCGIMDQFVTTMGRTGHAMLLDCRSEQPNLVPLADPELVVLVTNSNVKHKLAGSQYPVRVSQCEAALEALKKRYPEMNLLRDASPAQVEEIKGDVEEVVYHRARHVVTENARTVDTALALGEGDYGRVGAHMLSSHASLREDYEVSCPELDILVSLAMEVEGVYGSRLTGAGFGGCTVTLVKKDSVEDLMRHLSVGYRRLTGKSCTSFVTKPGHGSRGLAGALAAEALDWSEARCPERD